MTHRTLLILAALYLGLIGLGMLLVPQYFGMGAVPPDPSPALIAFLRIFGGPCLGIAALNWSLRNAPYSTALSAVLLANTVGFGITAAADIWGVSHEARAIAKVFLVVHFAFAIAFARALSQAGHSRSPL